jgi:hypothetical protein
MNLFVHEREQSGSRVAEVDRALRSDPHVGVRRIEQLVNVLLVLFTQLFA